MLLLIYTYQISIKHYNGDTNVFDVVGDKKEIILISSSANSEFKNKLKKSNK
jgi:hypothetical protein